MTRGDGVAARELKVNTAPGTGGDAKDAAVMDAQGLQPLLIRADPFVYKNCKGARARFTRRNLPAPSSICT